MKTIFGILLLLFLAASAAIVAIRNPGYVLIAREPFVLETSLAIFLLLEVVLFVALYYSVRLVVRIVRVPASLERWRQARRTRKARAAFREGLDRLVEGKWLDAEKSLLAGMHAADSAYLSYLGAALAAQGQHKYDKRDDYLTQAHEQAGTEVLTVDMARARLQLLANQPEQALATLARIRAHDPAQPEAARLLITVYRKLHDWQGLAHLLPEARRRKLLPEAELEAAEIETHGQLLALPLPPGSLDTLHQAWEAVPKALRQQPQLVSAYARQLARQQAMDERAQLLAATLDKRWDEHLVKLYGETAGPQPAAQLEIAEEWLARQGESAALLLTLGRLAQRAGQPAERVRSYLERSLALQDSADGHEELASLFAAGGDSARAMDHCRRALERCREVSRPEQGGAPGSAGRGASDYGY